MEARASTAPRRSRPAILIGGADGNALSVARSLGRQGVDVFLLPSFANVFSRYARYIEVPAGVPHRDAWIHYLLGPASEPLRGAVLLSCCDAGIEILIEHREELSGKFILDISNTDAQECLLSKLSTYQKAVEAGVPTPRFWTAESIDEVRARREEYVYPLIVKPLYSHRFQGVFGDKFFRATGFSDLVASFELAKVHDLEVVFLEEIPGPDDLLCSYYTYLDESGVPLCDFTKRIIRRYPENRGPACYHVTDWNPEVRDLGLRLFRHVGLQGVGNVEFKRDVRDGQLKIIECNARFTAGNALLVASGFDLGLFVYNRLAGVPQEGLQGRAYTQGLHYWFPDQDFRAFLALRRQGRLSVCSWLMSVAHRQVLPYFRWDDPLPSAVSSWRAGRRLVASVTAWMQESRGSEMTQRPFWDGAS